MHLSHTFEGHTFDYIQDVIDWCNKNMGLGGFYDPYNDKIVNRWAYTFEYGKVIFLFSDEEDFFWFSLRWI